MGLFPIGGSVSTSIGIVISKPVMWTPKLEELSFMKLKRLIRRQLSENSTLLQEDLRKIGLVLTGGGIFALFFQGNIAGILVMVFGVVTWIFGLTEQREEVDD